MARGDESNRYLKVSTDDLGDVLAGLLAITSAKTLVEMSLRKIGTPLSTFEDQISEDWQAMDRVVCGLMGWLRRGCQQSILEQRKLRDVE